jgi:hypothetical protein
VRTVRTLRRGRTWVKAVVIATALVASAGAVEAQPAHALSRFSCGQVIGNYNYWANEFYGEFVRSGGEYTDYLGYTSTQMNNYADLARAEGC